MPQNKPRLLDLFCGAGGCSMGYYQAGFEVVGVDIKPQLHYPFEFIQADAMTYPLDGFDFIHASPPCQAYSVCTPIEKKESHPDLLGLMRTRLLACSSPWVIENVIGAPIHYGVMLCGSHFRLPIQRHRWFETSWLLFSPGPCFHNGIIYSVHGNTVWLRNIKGSKHGTAVSLAEGKKAMGIDWMTKSELTQAIPPAYTEWIGNQWMDMFRNTRPLLNTNQPGAGLPCGKRTTC